MIFVPASAFETGQPALAAAAISWNFASSIPGTLPSVVRWIPVIEKPSPSFAKLCAAPITALARGPEGKIWFAAGNTVERFEPPPLALRFKRVSRKIGKKGELTMRIACRGGAGGQKCGGRIELLRGSRSLERSPYRAVSGSIKEVGVPLNTRTIGLLRAQSSLRVRLVLVTGGKQTDARDLDLAVTR